MSEPTAAVAPPTRLGRLPLLLPLQHRDYRLVWFGESVSLLGDQFHYVALSWLVLGMTGSGLALGTVLLASALPRGAFLLVGCGVGFLNVSIIAWTQARTEPHLLGRTMSFLMLGSVVAAPLSLGVAGALVDIDATAMFLAAGGMIVVVSIVGLVTGLHRRMAW